ncbi:hypothetical protein [Archangium violaceum]|uniref:hypothetical protein n=1 Tax=Archangium violaceum TaxID=83451 RepID=UPI001EF7006C|nr:hypothetical protein [Archangium violaceum]
MEERGWAYRRRQPEGTVLYEAVRDNLATLLVDVFTCQRCGGRRRVLAYLTAPGGVRAILEHLGLPSWPAQLAPAQGPAQLAWC